MSDNNTTNNTNTAGGASTNGSANTSYTRSANTVSVTPQGWAYVTLADGSIVAPVSYVTSNGRSFYRDQTAGQPRDPAGH
ncbi:hypothetical protein I302_108044 [Kwoniella bestiolae CBS 10118]|uniref:Uncharacterized protein n=1 Tax=Kwoniella bestiolae CBS 10118 TaxID=1296100 RepID=A0A1B9FWU0_9TREE|nr:hypothetical protein I302_07590 [Kwoniella bestiolae CBS 10118]OCF23236.1 hypothetical protein I302_07590 [Kwoniella bestiolae CBS 10118]